ncbi:MAG: hypothetical protein IPJ34_39070 [Myxococcales bacterium]|nr:hypothetical protein [Myxococcales bacterium]
MDGADDDEDSLVVAHGEVTEDHLDRHEAALRRVDRLEGERAAVAEIGEVTGPGLLVELHVELAEATRAELIPRGPEERTSSCVGLDDPSLHRELQQRLALGPLAVPAAPRRGPPGR